MSDAAAPVSICTPRLRLAPLVAADTAALHALWTAPGVRRFLWDGRSISYEQSAQLVARSEVLFYERGLGLWTARLADEEVLAGFCGYWHFRSDIDVELLYGLAEPYWGSGLGTEMARAMVHYGFKELAMGEVRASTDAPNQASLRILRRLGFLRQHIAGAQGSSIQFFKLPRGVYLGAGLDEES